jgi:hypothetical protein
LSENENGDSPRRWPLAIFGNRFSPSSLPHFSFQQERCEFGCRCLLLLLDSARSIKILKMK